jgi:hypothetical protein
MPGVWRSRHLAAVALGAALLVSCGEGPSRGLVAPPADAALLGPSGLLTCAAAPAESSSATIGPAGGTLRVGAHALWVPAGALSQDVTLSGVTHSGSVAAIILRPAGLEFAEPVFLTISYASCGLVPSLLPKRIAYTTAGLAILRYLTSWDNPLAQHVTGRLEHFSTYAVAW